MGNEIYKYTPQDFKPMSVDVIHMDLNFDVYEDHTNVLSDLKAKTKDTEISKLELNAKNLEITAVSCNFCDVDWNYDFDADKLIVNFKTTIPANTEFVIHTENSFKPTGNVLEGMYFDETPKGAPQQLITQCQQWGFQRMLPCFDEMNVKCTYITTISADKRYTNIITNGDLVEGPTPISDDRVKLVYNNTITPMTSYLFFLGLGTYATFTREFEYPNGHTFTLELLAPPETNKDLADKSLAMLFDGVLFINLFTGKDKCENKELAKNVYDLVYKREELKLADKNVDDIRKELKELSSGKTWGYEYTGTVYREIGMQNSNFGGMENVGNTTISTNRLLPFEDSSDGIIEYVTRVKTHEFYHNLNGSEVTGWSPFELWLNEAVTVHIEKEHHEFLFGESYSRLQEVLSLLSPANGVLAEDEGTMVLPIMPEGFNNPDELITSVTYIKGPEFIKMTQLLLGDSNFVKALASYHEKFKHSSAKSDDWIDAMDEYVDFDFKKFAYAWLKRTGFPRVDLIRSYDKASKTYKLELDQTNATEKDFWQFPLIIALCDEVGTVLDEKTIFVDSKTKSVVFENVDIKPAFVSVNRNQSFYGMVFDKSITEEELFLQAKYDKDLIARYLAYYFLTDKEKTRLLKNPNSLVRDELTDLYFNYLSDEKLMDEVGPLMIANFEGVEDPAFAHKYEDLYQVKKKMSSAVTAKYAKEIRQLYNHRATRTFEGDYLHVLAKQIKNRAVKSVCLSLLKYLENQEVYDLIKKEFRTAKSASERNLAASLYMDSNASDRMDFFKEFEEFGKQNLVRWEVFLSIASSCDKEDVLDLIDYVTSLPEFRMDQANDQRATYMRFAFNKRLSLLTESGRKFLKSAILKLTPVNEYTAMNVLSVLSHIDPLDEEPRTECYKLLLDVYKAVDSKKAPGISNNAKKILSKSPKAKASYEAKYGLVDL